MRDDELLRVGVHLAFDASLFTFKWLPLLFKKRRDCKLSRWFDEYRDGRANGLRFDAFKSGRLGHSVVLQLRAGAAASLLKFFVYNRKLFDFSTGLPLPCDLVG